MKYLISLAIALIMSAAGMGQIYLDDISVALQGDSVAIDIKTTQPCPYEHFMLQDPPQKIVIDLKETINNWAQQRYQNLPFKSLDKIRTSQFQVKPDLIARVVLDVNRPVGYRVEELPSGVRIIIPKAENEQQFAPWNTNQKIKTVSAPPKPASKPSANKPKSDNKAKVKPKKGTTKVEDFPKRKAIKYKSKTSRDPFKNLVGQGATIKSGQLPSVENLTLVGVFDDDNGMKALFEDAEGNGYILKANDRVQNGYLVSIYKEKAVFQVTEYGWKRMVALNLQLPELK